MTDQPDGPGFDLGIFAQIGASLGLTQRAVIVPEAIGVALLDELA